jgi:hypothetical protein
MLETGGSHGRMRELWRQGFPLASLVMLHKLASLYLNGVPAVPTLAELADLRAWIDGEFASIPPKVEFTAADVSPELLIDTYRSRCVILISTANIDHPYLTNQHNARFRAIHDWHHLRTNAAFDLPGEIQAFKTAAQSAPMAIRWMLHSEIVLQAAACIFTGKFQPQKLVRC